MPMREALNVLSRKNLGIVVAVNRDEKISGVFTTGDLMRLLEDGQSFLDKPLLEFAHHDPKTIAPEELAAKALHVMETHSITCLVVADQENRPIGIVQIYYILRAGVLITETIYTKKVI
jgi:arabinose-5-phosphate isomerase